MKVERVKMNIKTIVPIVLMILLILTAVTVVNAKNIEISANYSSKEINSFFNRGTSLNGQTLANGDTVIFQKGTYEGLSLKITKSVNIKAKGTVKFKGDYSNNVAIKINTKNVEISGLSIQNYYSTGIIINGDKNKIVKTSIKSCSDGISISGSNNRVTNNKIQSNSENGIKIKKGSKNTIDKNIINNNRLYGVYITNSNSNKIINNNINKNNDGITLFRASMNTISKNRLEKHTWNGLYIRSSSSNNKIKQNMMISNNCGIYSHMSSKNNIGKNTYSKNNIISTRFY